MTVSANLSITIAAHTIVYYLIWIVLFKILTNIKLCVNISDVIRCTEHPALHPSPQRLVVFSRKAWKFVHTNSECSLNPSDVMCYYVLLGPFFLQYMTGTWWGKGVGGGALLKIFFWIAIYGFQLLIQICCTLCRLKKCLGPIYIQKQIINTCDRTYNIKRVEILRRTKSIWHELTIF